MAGSTSPAGMEECPVCGEPSLEVLHETAEHRTVRCTACGETRTVAPRHARRTTLRLVLSDGERSWSGQMEVPTDERVAVGDEFEHEGGRFLVTGIERRDGLSATAAPVQDLRTCYAKRFDEVVLRFTLNEGETTRSLELAVSPEQRVHVGDVLEVQERRVLVKALKSDLNRTLRRGFLLARNVRRVFCDPAPEGGQKARRPSSATTRRSAPRRGPSAGRGPVRRGTGPSRGGPDRDRPGRGGAGRSGPGRGGAEGRSGAGGRDGRGGPGRSGAGRGGSGRGGPGRSGAGARGGSGKGPGRRSA